MELMILSVCASIHSSSTTETVKYAKGKNALTIVGDSAAHGHANAVKNTAVM
jgi:hypothetical protein